MIDSILVVTDDVLTISKSKAPPLSNIIQMNLPLSI